MPVCSGAGGQSSDGLDSVTDAVALASTALGQYASSVPVCSVALGQSGGLLDFAVSAWYVVVIATVPPFAVAKNFIVSSWNCVDSVSIDSAWFIVSSWNCVDSVSIDSAWYFVASVSMPFVAVAMNQSNIALDFVVIAWNFVVKVSMPLFAVARDRSSVALDFEMAVVTEDQSSVALDFVATASAPLIAVAKNQLSAALGFVVNASMAFASIAFGQSSNVAFASEAPICTAAGDVSASAAHVSAAEPA
jgi:hypothetical protein